MPDLDADRIAVAYSSERWFRMDGRSRAGFAPLSAFFPTMDGWVRTHANYPHHRAALLLGLGLSRDARRIDADAEDVDSDAETRQRVAARLATMSTAAAAAGVTAAGGLCVAVRPEDRSADDSWHRHPLVEIRRLGARAGVGVEDREARDPRARDGDADGHVRPRRGGEEHGGEGEAEDGVVRYTLWDPALSLAAVRVSPQNARELAPVVIAAASGASGDLPRLICSAYSNRRP